jgi:hypothetical protein
LLRRHRREQPKGLELRRAELELRFWTLRETLNTAEHCLKVLALATVVVYAACSTIEGHPMGLDYLLRALG